MYFKEPTGRQLIDMSVLQFNNLSCFSFVNAINNDQEL